MYAPILLLYRAFDASIKWSDSLGGFSVTRGSGGIKPGSSFYKSDEVYWLSRIISAEARGEPLRGKIAVAFLCVWVIKALLALTKAPSAEGRPHSCVALRTLLALTAASLCKDRPHPCVALRTLLALTKAPLCKGSCQRS